MLLNGSSHAAFFTIFISRHLVTSVMIAKNSARGWRNSYRFNPSYSRDSWKVRECFGEMSCSVGCYYAEFHVLMRLCHSSTAQHHDDKHCVVDNIHDMYSW